MCSIAEGLVVVEHFEVGNLRYHNVVLGLDAHIHRNVAVVATWMIRVSFHSLFEP